MTGTIFRDERVQLWLIWNDHHIPWHCIKKMEMALYLALDMGVTHILLGGDFLDVYNLNAHGPKSPHVKKILDDEFEAGIDVLSWIRKIVGYEVKLVFCAGNHEDRLDRFVMKHCPNFYNHLTIEKMLQLDHFKVEYYPYNQPYLLTDNLRFQHSPPSYSQNAAKTSMVKKVDIDHVYGCTHRPDVAYITGASGKVYTTICNGWFGKLDIIKKNIREMPENRRVYHFTKNHESWGCSATFAHIYNGKHTLQHIPIMKDNRGKVFCSVGANYYEL